jgi:hypothetical protein
MVAAAVVPFLPAPRSPEPGGKGDHPAGLTAPSDL